VNPTALRAAVVIAAVYGHFLIFAQFSFVELLRVSGVNATGERAALGAMAVALGTACARGCFELRSGLPG